MLQAIKNFFKTTIPEQKTKREEKLFNNFFEIKEGYDHDFERDSRDIHNYCLESNIRDLFYKEGLVYVDEIPYKIAFLERNNIHHIMFLNKIDEPEKVVGFIDAHINYISQGEVIWEKYTDEISQQLPLDGTLQITDQSEGVEISFEKEITKIVMVYLNKQIVYMPYSSSIVFDILMERQGRINEWLRKIKVQTQKTFYLKRLTKMQTLID